MLQKQCENLKSNDTQQTEQKHHSCFTPSVLKLAATKIKYVVLRRNYLRQIDTNRFPRYKLKFKQCQINDGDNIKKVISKTMGQINYQNQYRVWLVSNRSLNDLYQHLVNRSKYSITFIIEGMGKLILDQNQKLHQLQIRSQNYFIIEVKDSQNLQWFLQNGPYGKCQHCRNQKYLPIQCKCRKSNYCSIQCQNNMKNIHNLNCQYLKQQKLRIEFQNKNQFHQKSKNGLIGLINLKNTCYMNCILQCLSHLQPLTKYFLSGLHIIQSNKTNNLGTKGALAKAYGQLIVELWMGSQKSILPSQLKKQISEFNKIFIGNDQQDSHEFFSILIDGLHQDLNRVKHKVGYSQASSNQNKSDKLAAIDSWVSFSKRNQSIVVDLLTGQYKSNIICPVCNKKWRQFDPFFTVTLPISSNKTWINLFAVNKSMIKPIKIGWIQNNYQKAQQWIQQAIKIMKMQKNVVSMYVLTKNQSIYKVTQQKLSKIGSKILAGKPLFLFQLHQQDINYDIEIPVYFEGLSWYKFPIFCQKKMLLGIQLIKKAFRMLYGQSYRYRKMGLCCSDVTEQQYLKSILSNKKFKLTLLCQRIQNSYQPKIPYQYAKQIPINLDTDVWPIIEKLNSQEYQLKIKLLNRKQFSSTNLYRYTKIGQTPAQESVTLYECFESFQASEYLEVGNEWYCDSCQTHRLAKKQMKIYKAPDVLVLHLKRFIQKEEIKVKNQTSVIFPHTLNMENYLIDHSPMKTYNEFLKDLQIFEQPYKSEIINNTQPIYQLFSCSCHMGGLSRGHYTAFIKNQQKWYKFNDDKIYQSNSDKVITPQAYILFYKRKSNL